MSRPKSKFLIWIIVFDKHELIVHVIQGLSLSTASLVVHILSILIIFHVYMYCCVI